MIHILLNLINVCIFLFEGETFSEIRCYKHWHSFLVQVLWRHAGINSLCCTSVLVWLAQAHRELLRESNGGHSHPRMQHHQPAVCFSQEHSRKPSALPVHVLCERTLASELKLRVCPSHKATLSAGVFHQLYKWRSGKWRKTDGWADAAVNQQSSFLTSSRTGSKDRRRNLSQIRALPLRAEAERQANRERVRWSRKTGRKGCQELRPPLRMGFNDELNEKESRDSSWKHEYSHFVANCRSNSYHFLL